MQPGASVQRTDHDGVNIHVFLRQTAFSSHGHLAEGAKNQYK